MKSTDDGANPVAGLLRTLKPRAGPLIITVFGDAIAPRSPDIWLGSLIAMMAELGLSERLVRTGVYRLARDGWLESRSRGRRSYYALTASGRDIFAEADARIYASDAPAWDGDWTLVQILPSVTPKTRQTVRDALKWQGYGRLSPTLLVKPQRRPPQIALVKAGVLDDKTAVSIFTARLEDLSGAASLRETASTAWNLSELNAAYGQFIEHFQLFTGANPVDPAHAFALRVLLIHEYRRILLKDPQLPAELLPQAWSGAAARTMAARLYHEVAVDADKFVTDTLENWHGETQPPEAALQRRFA
jgi:phenylacetic acid degradation operon negative regulatory protein